MDALLIAWSIPLMGLLILAEIIYSAWERNGRYTVADTAHNLLFTALNGLMDLLIRGVALLALTACWQASPLRWPMDGWHGWLYWGALFLAQDLAYYTLHCADHYVRLFWAVHVTHHNSEKFNFTVAIRSSVFQPVYRFLFYTPLAFVGFEPLHILFMYAACQAYGFWVHTESIAKLHPWVEAVLVTPSHHRVHHASNPQYIDRNMGMVLIIWDRLFGTFTPETEAVRYGITYIIEKPTTFRLIFGEWARLWADLRATPGLRKKAAVVFGRPV